jgi:hypothetical protein
MFSFYLSKKCWGHAWEDTAYPGYIDFDSGFSRAGSIWDKLGTLILVFSALCFLVASCVAVWSFYQAGLALPKGITMPCPAPA